jgi:hypothetical protein
MKMIPQYTSVIQYKHHDFLCFLFY